MDARVFSVDQYRITAGVVDELVLAGVEDVQLRRQPAADQNSLAWLLWHAARWEDVIVHSWVCNQPQVFDRQHWYDRLATGTRHVGTAMTPDEVGDLSERIDLVALRGYRSALAEATTSAIAVLDDGSFEEVVGCDRLVAGQPDGAFRNEQAAWMDDFWSGHRASWFLAFLNLHAAEHLLGEALVVRSQLGLPLGL